MPKNKKEQEQVIPVKHIESLDSIVTSKEFFPPHREKTMLNQIMIHKADGLYRTGNFSAELIWGKTGFIFPKNEKGSSFRKGLFLFSMVRKDAQKYLNLHEKIELPKKYPVNNYNYKFAFGDDAIAGTDINHCYWRIAYNFGIISERTYEKGLDENFKTLRLAALSSLGATKQYQVVKGGMITNEVVNIGGNEQLQTIYKLIRYTCYRYMQNLKKMLEFDFLAYRTDCIYYRKTKPNMHKVQVYLKSKNLETKQLYRVSNKRLKQALQK